MEISIVTIFLWAVSSEMLRKCSHLHSRVSGDFGASRQRCAYNRHLLLSEISGSHGSEYLDCRHHYGDDGGIVLMMESVSASETSVNLYETKRCNVPQHGYLRLLYYLSPTEPIHDCANF
jgi:hypothetical protein